MNRKKSGLVLRSAYSAEVVSAATFLRPLKRARLSNSDDGRATRRREAGSSAAENGLTLMELLIVLAIISLLVGLLLPALGAVRKAAREAKQQAQITTIELALVAFKNDYGDYPPSSNVLPSFKYFGSQKLSEALLGWDLLGCHPKSAWRADGLDASGGEWTYDPA
jgi:prepilin-type N-terminal cleavage/methylation domain-containing protein